MPLLKRLQRAVSRAISVLHRSAKAAPIKCPECGSTRGIYNVARESSRRIAPEPGDFGPCVSCFNPLKYAIGENSNFELVKLEPGTETPVGANDPLATAMNLSLMYDSPEKNQNAVFAFALSEAATLLPGPTDLSDFLTGYARLSFEARSAVLSLLFSSAIPDRDKREALLSIGSLRGS
ncbi:MAG TPA: hypothetical protein VMV27_13540 [Candidatus Binataceae bacterium]|nr:hypothetical protein [Candidatus Binataceae bacterium]